jgi:hypothetical protein
MGWRSLKLRFLSREEEEEEGISVFFSEAGLILGPIQPSIQY